VAFGIIGVFILPDYPDTTTWITPRERHIAEKRLAIDVGIVEEKQDESAWVGLKLAVSDPKVWLLGLTYHATIMGLSVSFSCPISCPAPSADLLRGSSSSSRPSPRLWATTPPRLFS
jgi:hypothetical protein